MHANTWVQHYRAMTTWTCVLKHPVVGSTSRVTDSVLHFTVSAMRGIYKCDIWRQGTIPGLAALLLALNSTLSAQRQAGLVELREEAWLLYKAGPLHYRYTALKVAFLVQDCVNSSII